MDDIPVINWFEEPIKQSIKSVFDGVNLGVKVWTFSKSIDHCISSYYILLLHK